MQRVFNRGARPPLPFGAWLAPQKQWALPFSCLFPALLSVDKQMCTYMSLSVYISVYIIYSVRMIHSVLHLSFFLNVMSRSRSYPYVTCHSIWSLITFHRRSVDWFMQPFHGWAFSLLSIYFVLLLQRVNSRIYFGDSPVCLLMSGHAFTSDWQIARSGIAESKRMQAGFKF